MRDSSSALGSFDLEKNLGDIEVSRLQAGNKFLLFTPPAPRSLELRLWGTSSGLVHKPLQPRNISVGCIQPALPLRALFRPRRALSLCWF